MPLDSPEPLAAPLRRHLNDLRARIRFWVAVRGVALTGAVGLALVLVWILLDRGWHLDAAILRASALLLLVGSTLLVGLRTLVRPLRSPVRDVDLALWMERRTGRLGGDLASAVELAALPHGGARLTVLERHLVERTVRHLPTYESCDIIDRRAIRSSLGAAVVAGLALAGFSAWRPDDVRLALARLSVPWRTLEWPRRHTLEYLDDRLQPIPPTAGWRVAKGENLTIYVAERSDDLPEAVVAELQAGDAPPESIPLRQASLRDDSGRTRPVAIISLVPQMGRMRLQARGGDDDRLPPLEIEVATPPMMETFRITQTPPAYSGLPPETVASGVGHVQGLVGTHVALSATSNVPLRSAVLHLGGDHVQSLNVGSDRRTVETAFQIASVERTSYWFELTDERGLPHSNPPRYEIRGLLDRDPTIRIAEPETDLRVVAQARIPLVIEANDDLGLRRLDLLVGMAGATAGDETRPLREFETPERDTRLETVLDVADMKVIPGTQIVVRARAVDRFDWQGATGQTALSAPRQITIVSDADKREELASRQASLVDALDRARSIESRALQQVRELQIQWTKVREWQDRDRTALTQAESAQQALRTELLDERRGAIGLVESLLQESQWNGFADTATSERLEHVRARLRELDSQALKEIEAALGNLRRHANMASDKEPAVASQLAATTAAQQQVVESLDALLANMQAWQNQESVRRKFAEIVATQEQVLEETREVGRRTISKAVQSLSSQEQANLARLADRQARLSQDLEAANDLANGPPDAAPPVGNDEPNSRTTPEGTSGKDVVGQMQQAASLIQGNRVENAGRLQNEILETLRKLDSSLRGQGGAEQQSLPQQLADERREVAGLRAEQEAIRRDAASLTKESDDPKARAESDDVRSRQADLQKRTADLARRLRDKDRRPPAASAGRSAARMAEARKSLEDENVAEAVQQQGESLDDLLQTERELARLEQAARVQAEIQALKEVGKRVREMGGRQAGVLEEVVRLDGIQSAEGRLPRAELRSLQQSRGTQNHLTGETEALVEEFQGRDVLRMATESMVETMRTAEARLERRELGEETRRLLSSAVSRLTQLADALDPTQTDSGQASPETGDGPMGPNSPSDVDSAALVAELTLLKTMQEDVLERTTQIVERRAGGVAESEATRRELVTLAALQKRLATLARDLLRPKGDDEGDAE